ncbi:hypothetical protein, partial [Streptomyces evansiae]|uniref:hypothetical protein n=2 Tax=Actinomycetes TaxID=1760 RepID=UPI002883BAB6
MATSDALGGAPSRRWRTGAVFAVTIGACLPLATPAHADEDPMMHRVTYTVTAEQPTAVGIYFREVDPPTWADY